MDEEQFLRCVDEDAHSLGISFHGASCFTTNERTGVERRQARTTRLNDLDPKSKVWHPDLGQQVWIDEHRTTQRRQEGK